MQTYDMTPLDSAACGKYGLSDKDASWCSTLVDIPASAAVVDFVISDRCGNTY
jgi:hypothetical protein